MQKRNMTCTVCPVGCRLEVNLDDNGGVAAVSGNTCVRGVRYAVAEITNPVRTLTSTVHLRGASEPFLPVRTASPVSKGRLFAAMERLRGVTVSAPVKTGDVVAAFDGVDIVACKTVLKKAV